ncbi:MAG: type VI secretion system baseplate subunit TssK [Planctomycetia bacterium]
MLSKAVHWWEGMLVLPHHFQAAQAHLLDVVASVNDWRHGYGYGLRAFEFLPEALPQFEVRVRRLHVRLRDGSMLCAPEAAHVSSLDLKQAFDDAPVVYVHAAVPEEVLGRANTVRHQAAASNDPTKQPPTDVRYLVGSEDWEDRNTAGNPRPVDVQRLNAQLLLEPSTEPRSGYESLPIARLRRSQREGVPEIDPQYIPPLLSCDAWPGLKDGILGAATASLGAFIKSQADYLMTHGGWNEANQAPIRKAIHKLGIVNGAYPYLAQLVAARNIHPFLAYTELCRLCGQLALFRPDWMAPELPLYDHDDLGRVFGAVRLDLDRVLRDEGPAVKVQRFPFTGVNDWMEVSLDPKWLDGRYGFFVGVRSDMRPEKLEMLFSDRWLDWKLGAARTIQQIYFNREAGLALARVQGVHPVLPALASVTYFRVDAQGQYWQQAFDNRTLALKVNPTYLRGLPVGQNVMTVIDPNQKPRDLALELFVVEND